MNMEKKHTPGPWKVSDKMMTDEMVCRHDTLGAWVHSCRYIEGAGKLLATAQSNEPIEADAAIAAGKAAIAKAEGRG